MNFIKEFVDEKKAVMFAKAHSGKVTIRYDWDARSNKIVKNYRVIF
jgi:hypothetical protein